MKPLDPRNFNWDSNSPYEIYAAGRWKGSRTDPEWRKRASKWAQRNSPVFRGEILPAQPSIILLAEDLFFLHLTVREASPEILRALSILKNMKTPESLNSIKSDDIPFENKGDPDFSAHVWLFSAAVFGLGKTPLWREAAERAGRKIQAGGKGLNSPCIYNFLRGTLVNPGSEKIPGVVEAVRLLAERQEASGYFNDIAPWQAYNLMAHSTHPEAVKIANRLEPPLLRQQNSDASWGAGSQKPLATFLMAHGLQNRGFFS